MTHENNMKFRYHQPGVKFYQNKTMTIGLLYLQLLLWYSGRVDNWYRDYPAPKLKTFIVFSFMEKCSLVPELKHWLIQLEFAWNGCTHVFHLSFGISDHVPLLAVMTSKRMRDEYLYGVKIFWDTHTVNILAPEKFEITYT